MSFVKRPRRRKGVAGGLAVALALLASAPAASADEPARELTVFGGYRFGGTFHVRDSDAAYEWRDASSFGLIWNHRHRGNTQWEVFFSRQESSAEFSEAASVDPVVDVETTVLQIGGTYLWDGDTVQPYLAATLGGTHLRAESVGSGSDTFLSGSIGLGIRVAPGSRVGLRLEARAHGALVSKSSRLFCRTGPDLNVCAVEVDGDIFGQLELFAGVSLRF